MPTRIITAQRTVDGVYSVTTAATLAPRTQTRPVQRPAARPVVRTRPAQVVSARIPPAQGQAAIPKRNMRRRYLIAAAIALPTLGALTWAVVWVLTTYWTQILTTAGVALGVWLLINRARHAGACPGLHCRGCRG